jgi:hypothetical protein
MKTRKIHGSLCNLGLSKDIIFTYTHTPFRSGPPWREEVGEIPEKIYVKSEN